jgi:hypothetical protein
MDMSDLFTRGTLPRWNYFCLVTVLLFIGGGFLAACGTGPDVDTEAEVTATADFLETDMDTPEDSETDLDAETPGAGIDEEDLEEPGMVEEAMTATTGIQQRTATATPRPTRPTATATATATTAAATATSAAVTDTAIPEPGEDEPAEDEPAEDEPAEDEPAEDEPAEDEPADDEPAEDEPAEEPGETTLEETPEVEQ